MVPNYGIFLLTNEYNSQYCYFAAIITTGFVYYACAATRPLWVINHTHYNARSSVANSQIRQAPPQVPTCHFFC